MTGFTSIDLSRLPPPVVIQTVDYDVLVAEMKDQAIAQMPELETFLALDSEPVTKLLRVCAYFRMLDRLAFNDGARACMLPFSTGADLDNLASFWGVARLVVQEANESVDPPLPELLEEDAAFRTRIQLSLEARTTAGPRGAYVYWALSADPDVRDVNVDSPAPGQVVVTVLSHSNDGAASNALLTAVEDALNDEDVRPLTDQLTVQAATILPFSITAELTIFDGPDAATVEAASLDALHSYLDTQSRLNRDVTLSGLFSALHQPGVQNVTITEPAADIVVGPAEAAHCNAIAVAIGGVDV